MKLLLTSEGLNNKTIEKAFFDLVGKKPEDLSVAYVITAPNASSSQDKRWVVNAIVKLNDLKIGKIDIIDPVGLSDEVWKPRLEAADVIFVEGGRVEHLLDNFKKLTIDKMLADELKEKVFVGSSAGSMIMGEKVISSKNTNGEAYEGFGFVSLSIRPHYSRGDRSQFNAEKIQELANNFESTFYALDDDSAIVVDGNKMEVVSEGKWEKFDK